MFMLYATQSILKVSKTDDRFVLHLLNPNYFFIKDIALRLTTTCLLFALFFV